MFGLVVVTYRPAASELSWFWLFCAKAVAARAERMIEYCILAVVLSVLWLT